LVDASSLPTIARDAKPRPLDGAEWLGSHNEIEKLLESFTLGD
jgi:hypothetical protein